ncbi:hypothetical protein ZHAS_00014030 [Anopheles sinensis]|uniref:Uncharacterized protein n=1 Tax=Anopheles sinensis TaxID=74873 RepID=A0A084W6Y3_ANOSI|nr:hypothetical protein ZHAS_00014030 [Anopheles sinensis]
MYVCALIWHEADNEHCASSENSAGRRSRWLSWKNGPKVGPPLPKQGGVTPFSVAFPHFISTRPPSPSSPSPVVSSPSATTPFERRLLRDAPGKDISPAR